MRTNWLRWMTILMMAAAVAASGSAAGADASGTIVGTVTGPSGGPLPGVVVSARDSSGAAATAVAGEGGAFVLAPVTPGSYVVAGTLPGFTSAPLDRVEVSAGRTTRIRLELASVTFRDTLEVSSAVPPHALEASELRESAASDLGEALAALPAVWKVRKGGVASDVVVRGFAEEDVTLLIDGARVAGACPNRMDPPAFHLDFAEVDRVELVSPAGRVTAGGSLGALVNVVTRKPGPGLTADVPLVVGSWGLVNPAATVGWGGERIGVLAGVSRRTSEPYADGSGRRFTELANYSAAGAAADAYDISTGWTRLFFRPAGGDELSLSFSRQEADDVLYPTLMMDAVFDTTERLVLGYHHRSRAGLVDELRVTAYGTRVEHWMNDGLRTTGANAPRGWGMGTEASTQVAGMSFEAERGRLIVGAEAYERRWDAWTELAMTGYRRQHSIPDVTVTALGAYARWSAELSPSSRLELGTRLDHVAARADEELAPTDLYFAYHGVRSTEHDDVEPSASLQLSHDLAGPLRLTASLATSTRSPDPRERYFGLRRMGGDWVGNPELEPPRALSAHVELGWDLGRGFLTASAWADRVDDFVTVYDQVRQHAVAGVTNSHARSYANVDALLRGAALEATAALGPRTSIAGQVAYVRGTHAAAPELGLGSGDLAEMPPLTARLAVRWQSPRRFGELETVMAARQDEVDSELNEEPTPGFGVVNATAGVAWRAWRLQVAAENLLDRTYHEHFSYLRDPYRSGVVVPEPGRRVAVTIGWRR